jgi:hypothetical protein
LRGATPNTASAHSHRGGAAADDGGHNVAIGQGRRHRIAGKAANLADLKEGMHAVVTLSLDRGRVIGIVIGGRPVERAKSPNR